VSASKGPTQTPDHTHHHHLVQVASGSGNFESCVLMVHHLESNDCFTLGLHNADHCMREAPPKGSLGY